MTQTPVPPLARSLLIPILMLGLCPLSLAQQIRVSGFLSQGYIESSQYNYLADTEDGDFEFAELALNISWTPFERTTINGQLLSFDLGQYGNFQPIIEYLFLDYNLDKCFGFRLGRIKREQGIYNHIQDIDIARTGILLPMGVYDHRYRDTSSFLDGISAYGTIAFHGNQSIDYSIYGGVLGLERDGGVAGFALSEISRFALDPRIESIDSQYNVGGQVWYNPGIEGLRIGAAISYYPNGQNVSVATIPVDFPLPEFAGGAFRGISNEIDTQNVTFSAEYFTGD